MTDEQLAALSADIEKNMAELQKRKREIYYFDGDGKSTDAAHAVTAIARELDEQGNLIQENYLTIDPAQDEKKTEKMR